MGISPVKNKLKGNNMGREKKDDMRGSGQVPKKAK